MGDGFPFFDILFFAMVAAFLVLRLRGVLGRRTGNERPRPDVFSRPPEERAPEEREAKPGDNVVALSDRATVAAAVPPPPAAILAQLKVADPTFDEAGFLGGARAAFEMVVTAFANSDRDTLRPLCNDDVYGNLEGAIRDRERQGHVLDSTLVGMRSVEILEASLERLVAHVTVKFVSEQVNVTRDAQGRIVSGQTNEVVQTTDIWTFARDTRARDPNWLLVATRSPQ